MHFFSIKMSSAAIILNIKTEGKKGISKEKNLKDKFKVYKYFLETHNP